MKSIRFERVFKSFHGESIIQNLNLEIPSGSFFAILGPSGSGKTTLLRLIAGFEQPDKGRIFVDDKDVTEVAPHLRCVNTVFQNYALFPHMNVFENVAYGLMLRKIHPNIIKEKVMATLDKVHLLRHVYKAIDQLSGGQQQRVALARAIINEPGVLLFDEPLAALDLKLREKMLIELVELQDELKTTFVYVTHDQDEALMVADYLAILNEDGDVEQVGTPKQIYEFPITTFVAQFVGTTNMLQGTLINIHREPCFIIKDLSPLPVQIPKDADWVEEGVEAVMSIRPEKIDLILKEPDSHKNYISGTIEAIIYHGRSTQYNVRVLQDLLIRVFLQNEEHSARNVVMYDDIVYLHWHKDSVVLFKE